jgi:hypothetical protein
MALESWLMGICDADDAQVELAAQAVERQQQRNGNCCRGEYLQRIPGEGGYGWIGRADVSRVLFDGSSTNGPGIICAK